MLSQWLQQARNGRSVWLSDVRRGCEVLPEHVAVTVQLTLCDGSRRDFSLPIPRWADGEQRQFVQQYVTAFVFNTLSALSGREMAFYLDLRETEVVALLGELNDIFQVHKTARSGYGKVINIANRLCRPFGGGTFSFAVRDRSAYVPAPPEVSRGGDLLPRLRRSVERCGSGVCCGIDIGGTDIKAAVAVDGRLVCVKEYDWNPAASLVAEGITGPIVLLVQLMACCAAGMTPALQAALDKDASDEEMTRAVAQSASVPLDVLGVSFPDVVIRDRIVGGESPKTKGMRENPAIDYETAFAGLGGLVDQLRPLCREGAALHMTNDGHIAAFTAAAELAFSGGAPDFSGGVIAHALGTDFGVGYLDSDGSIPEMPVELYDFLLDLGSFPQRQLPPEDLRSTRNENSGLPGARRYLGQAAAFRLGGGGFLAPCQRVEDFLAHRPSTGPGAVLPSYRPGVTWCDLHDCLPSFLTEAMEEALPLLERKLRGYAQPDALLTAVETRSSSPVRILRDESGQSALRGLYPCGEGAGYAGGIVSAGVDGERCAEAVANYFNH